MKVNVKPNRVRAMRSILKSKSGVARGEIKAWRLEYRDARLAANRCALNATSALKNQKGRSASVHFKLAAVQSRDMDHALEMLRRYMQPEHECECCGGEAGPEYFSAANCNDTGRLVTMCATCAISHETAWMLRHECVQLGRKLRYAGSPHEIGAILSGLKFASGLVADARREGYL